MCKKLAIKRWIVAVLLLVSAVAACRGRRSGVSGGGEAKDSRPLSTVAMNDPRAAAQLISGFYAIENRAWRWSAGMFSVQLRTPPGAGAGGATLKASFTIPDVEIQKLGGNGLSASINGTALQSQKYDAAGSYTFTADVPASLLAADTVQVDFTVDSVMRPDGDRRELGLIMKSVGISAK